MEVKNILKHYGRIRRDEPDAPDLWRWTWAVHEAFSHNDPRPAELYAEVEYEMRRALDLATQH